MSSVEALYRKLEREFIRTFHQHNPTHKADHFYNFCITAHSLRDYLLERLGKTTYLDKKPFETTWSAEPILVAAADIANSVKHFQLRHRGAPRLPRTKKVRPGRTTVVTIYESSDGQIAAKKRTNVPTYVVVVEDGHQFELYSFMDAVIKYWKVHLRNHGIKLRAQSLRSLHGDRHLKRSSPLSS